MSPVAAIRTTAAMVMLVSATACAPPQLAGPPPPPADLDWVRCPAGSESRGQARLGEGAARVLEVEGHRLLVPPGLAPPRSAELVVHRSAALYVSVNVEGDAVPGGATLELSLRRCPDAIPEEGHLYLYKLGPRGGPHELVDSASAGQLQRDSVFRAEGIEEFSGFVIAT